MNKKKIFLIIIIFILIILLGTIIFFIFKPENESEPAKIEKQNETIKAMKDNNTYKEEYINEYNKINYVDIKDFATSVNKLLDKNYNAEEINYILTNNLNSINIILNMEHFKILDFVKISNFEIDKIKRYLDYQAKNKDYDLKTIITYVNIGLDLEGYSKYQEYTIEQAEKDITILVNKYHKLPENYEPSDLVSLSYNSTYKLRKEAAEAYEKLTKAAKEENVIFYPFSPYRSYETQFYLYNRYVSRDGKEKADTYSARPGFSEHQLGLAVDVRSDSLWDNLTEEHYKWMIDNSYKYGYIIRYPKGKQHITQFIEEPWHLRYLGIDLATKVHDSELTYDEYYDLYMTNH